MLPFKGVNRVRASGDHALRVAYFVAPSPAFAGIERTVHEIATGLVELAGDAVDVHVVYASRYDEAILADAVYRKYELGIDRLFALPVSVRRVFAAIDPDVVVFPQVEAATIGWLATRLLGIPLFLAHLHGNPLVEEREGTRRSRLAFAVFRHIVTRRIGGVLAVSPSLASHAAASLVRGAPVRFVPNPVRRLPIPPDRVREPGPYRFVSVGRLSRQKGHDVLLHALRAARDAGLTDARVVLVGDGPEREALEHLASELDLADVVEFAGYTTDPGSRLAEADCFVLASRWEGFGVALVEAMQYGLPLLSTDCEFGPRDIVVDDRIGRLVREGDAHALGLAMLAMAATDDDAESRSFRRHAATAYERGPAVRRHLAVLRELAAASRVPGLRRFATGEDPTPEENPS